MRSGWIYSHWRKEKFQKDDKAKEHTRSSALGRTPYDEGSACISNGCQCIVSFVALHKKKITATF